METPRFTRYQHHDRIHFRVHAPEAKGEELRIAFSHGFLENNAVSPSGPEPDGAAVTSEGGAYAYRIEDWSKPMTFTFDMEPRKAFRSPGTAYVTAGEGEPVELRLDAFVYP